MRRLTSLLIILALLSSGLAFRQVSRCAGASCGSEKRAECSVEKACAAMPIKGHCGQSSNSASCCICFVNCCYYLLPTTGFSLRSLPDVVIEKPQGLQHRYAQLFYHAIWHPPSAIV